MFWNALFSLQILQRCQIMKYLYLILDIATISIPLLVSFHPRLQFYRKWKPLFLSLIISSAFYIIWDIFFTKYGIWGFNETYFIGIKIANLPIEEWLFFICIPYACVFTHYALLELIPKLSYPKKYFNHTIVILIFSCILLSLFFHQKWYTLINYAYCAILLTAVYRYKRVLLQQYLVTFLFILIPFFIVNGILTGTGIEEEVVWYNNEENLNFRIGTIPVEDIIYAFTLILTNISLLVFFEKDPSLINPVVE